MEKDYKKDIIIDYHIPVDGLSHQQVEEQFNNMMKHFQTGEFFREYLLPKKDSGGKIDIEIINLKGQKTEHIQIKIEELDDRLMKYFEPEKWKRKSKLERIVKSK